MSRVSKGFSNLTEIARAAGVSTATVSRALANNPKISAATRARVQELARAHGFAVNSAARALRTRRAHAIGLVLPLGHETGQHLSDPFLNMMIAHVADAVTARGNDLLLSRVIPIDDHWLDRMVDGGRVDGLIVIGQSDQTAVLDRVAERFAPLLVWGAFDPAHRHLTVGSDNVLGGRLAAEHLIRGGRKQLLFLGNPDAPEIGQRRTGFLQACGAAGIADAARTLPTHLTIDETYAGLADYLANHPAPDGIVAASDIMAMGAIRALSEQRIRVPEDVAVIGYDDVLLAAHTTPALTTVRQPIARGAALLVDLLFRRMVGEQVNSVVLPPELIVRRSA